MKHWRHALYLPHCLKTQKLIICFPNAKLLQWQPSLDKNLTHLDMTVFLDSQDDLHFSSLIKQKNLCTQSPLEHKLSQIFIVYPYGQKKSQHMFQSRLLCMCQKIRYMFQNDLRVGFMHNMTSTFKEQAPCYPAIFCRWKSHRKAVKLKIKGMMTVGTMNS